MHSNLPKIDLHKPYGIFSVGIVIIFHFGDLLFAEIDKGLTNLYGDQWQIKMQKDEILTKNFNFRDPQAVLKEVARNGSSQFRFPLNLKIAQNRRGIFYDGLDDLLGERNAWIHRQIQENISELNDLALSTSHLLELCQVDFDYSQWVKYLAHTAEEGPPLIDEFNTKVIREEKGTDMNELTIETQNVSELRIGDPVTTRFLSHSYVIGEGGDVLDRNTNQKLSEFNPQFQSSLGVLTKNLKVGSRLRVTQEGYLCSFFEDHWGYLTQISGTEWFPNHLR